MTMQEKNPQEILSHYTIGPVGEITQLTSGLINTTYSISTNEGGYILQCLGAIFDEKTVEDMEKVTLHLASKQVVTPRVLHTNAGGAYHKDTEGRVWRLMTRIDGVTYDHLPDDAYAAEAGKVLAQFHIAMEDFDTAQLKSIPILHQTQKFYDTFCEVYDQLMGAEPDKEQRLYYQYIYEKMPSLMLPSDLPTTVIHADPKISNVIFKNGKGICMIDLDTCMKHTPLVDLGDALWSLCGISEITFPNPFSLQRFSLTMQGYGSVQLLAAEIKEYMPQAVAMVSLGLASRFAKDVHYDNYFGWDPSRFSSRREHNKQRTKSLVSLVQDITNKQQEMLEIVRRY